MCYFVGCDEDLLLSKIKEKFGNVEFTYLEVNSFLKSEGNEYFLKELNRQIELNPNYCNFYRLVWLVVNNVFLKNCLTCGKQLDARKTMFGGTYCCKSCETSSPEWRRKREDTNLKKYGTLTPLKNEEVKEKTKKTCQEKFGSDMFAGSEEYLRRVRSPFLDKEVQEKSLASKKERYGEGYGKSIFEKARKKIVKTNLERYGVEFVLQSKEHFDKSKKTRKERYGSEYFYGTSQLKRIKFNLMYDRFTKSWSKFVIPLFTKEEYFGMNKGYMWECVRCGFHFDSRIYTNGFHGENHSIPRCCKCYPRNRGFSKLEKEVLDFVKSFYHGEIVENTKQIIKPYELDIYLPDKKIAIEFDGVFWHSVEKGDTFNKQLTKTKLCQEKGIKLIHVFENEWLLKNETVKKDIQIVLDENYFNLDNYGERVAVDLRYPFQSFFLERGYNIIEEQPPVFIVISCKEDQGIWDCGKLILEKK